MIKQSAASAGAAAASRPGARVRGRLRRRRRASTTPRSTSRADTVLVLRNSGPRGGPGMPEWGQVPIPKKLLAQGVTDMVRVSDARMSGTAFGTVVLHVAPESAAGGPLARGARRRSDRPRRRRAAHRPRRARPPRSRAASPSTAPRRARVRARLRRALSRARAAGRRGLRLRLPARPARASRPRASRSVCSAAGWAAGDLEHHLAARAVGARERGERVARSRRARSGA